MGRGTAREASGGGAATSRHKPLRQRFALPPPHGFATGRIRAASGRYPPLRPPSAARSRARPQGRSEEHTSELQSLMRISYAVVCLKKKKNHINNTKYTTQRHKHTSYPRI